MILITIQKPSFGMPHYAYGKQAGPQNGMNIRQQEALRSRENSDRGEVFNHQSFCATPGHSKANSTLCIEQKG